MNWKSLSIPAFFIFLHTAEILYPNRQMKLSKWRFYHNIGFVVIWLFFALFFIEQPVLIIGHELFLQATDLFSYFSYNYTMPTFLYAIYSFLVLDYSIYILHRLSHRIPILWRLHQIHH